MTTDREPMDQRIGGYVVGVLIVLVIAGIAVDAFIRPAYWLMGNP